MNKPRSWKCPWTSSKKRAKNENTAMSEQAKVGEKLKLRLWDQACKISIESRVKKAAVVIVHVLSSWLASSFPIRRAFLQHISWRVFVEIVINKRKSSCHFAWRNGSITAWMFVHLTKTASDIGLERFSYQSGIISISIRKSLSLSREKVKHNHSLSKVYRFI